MKWITRERVKVDRVACPWLIKKFVDPAAEFLFVPADKVMEVADDDTVQLLFSSEVTAVKGAEYLTGVEIRDLATGVISGLTCDAVFPYIGLQPNSDWLGDLVERSPDGAVITDAGMRTKTPGLFAIGAMRNAFGGRLTDALGEASAAVAQLASELVLTQ